MLYCIQGWVGTNRNLPDWSLADDRIAYVNAGFIQGRFTALKTQEQLPSRYLYTYNGIERPGFTFTIRFPNAASMNAIWNWFIPNMDQWLAGAFIVGYRLQRHECNHDDLSVPEGIFEVIERP